MRKLYLVPYAVMDGGFATLGDVPQIQALRPAILYWDEVTVPVPIPGMLPILDGHLDFLRSANVVRTYNIQPTNSFSSEVYVKFANDLSQQLTAMAGQNDWSVMCPAGNQQSLIEFCRRIAGGNSSTTGGSSQKMLEMAFRDALPVPPDGIAFDDILDFKDRRKDELNELNLELDLLSVELSGAESLDEALRVGKQKIESSLVAIDKVFSEKWISRVRSSLQLSVPMVMAGSIVGAVSASKLELSALDGAAVGAIATPMLEAMIKSFQSSGKIPERARPFLYAYEAGRQFRAK